MAVFVLCQRHLIPHGTDNVLLDLGFDDAEGLSAKAAFALKLNELMRRQLRDAAKGQFTGTRLAMLVAQLHALAADQLLNLGLLDSSTRANAHGLQIMTSDFLQSDSHTTSKARAKFKCRCDSEATAIQLEPLLRAVLPNHQHPDAR